MVDGWFIFVLGLAFIWFFLGGALVIFTCIYELGRRAAYRRGLQRGELHCGQCRYNVRGVSALKCPECGSDLRVVGIKKIEDRVVTMRGSRIILWTVLMPPVLAIFAALITPLIPWLYRVSCHVTLEPSVDSKTAVAMVTVSGHGRGLGIPKMRTVEISHWGDFSNWEDQEARQWDTQLTVDLSKMRFQDFARPTSPSRLLTADNLTAPDSGWHWPANDAQRRQRAETIVAVVTALRDRKSPDAIATLGFRRAETDLYRNFDPPGWTFVLMAGESMAINAMLERSSDSTSALAAWATFDRALRFLSMPMIALGVAMLPLAARLYGSREFGRIHRELRVALGAGVLYLILFVTPIALFFGDVFAERFFDEARAREYLALGMKLLPLAVLVSGPMFVMRSTFEGMQRPTPGLTISVVRAVLLVVPLAWLGMHFAPDLGWTEMGGLYAGVMTGVAVATLAMTVWLIAAFRQCASEA